MKSFKLESSKNNTQSTGAILIVLGIVGGLLIHEIGWLFVLVGIVLLVIAKYGE